MKKTLLALLGLLVCVPIAHSATETYEVMLESCTFSKVTVSSYTGTQLLSAELVGATTVFPLVMPDRKYIEFQNLGTSSGTMIMIDLSSTTAGAADLSLSAPGNLSATLGTRVGKLEAVDSRLKMPLPGKDESGRVYVPWAINCSGTGTQDMIIKQCK